MSAHTPEEIDQVGALMHALMVVIAQHRNCDPSVVLNAVLSTYLNCADWANQLDRVPQALAKVSTKATELLQNQNQLRPSGVPLH